MGETRRDRLELLAELASLEPQPESVPINQLVAIEGTPLHDQGVEPVDKFELVRMIATARILMPRAAVRLSAGRESMTEELQALCFLAGPTASSSATSSSRRRTAASIPTRSSSGASTSEPRSSPRLERDHDRLSLPTRGSASSRGRSRDGRASHRRRARRR
jgi:hypothetical protein